MGVEVLRELHDLALARKPEGATHEGCPLCAVEDPAKDLEEKLVKTFSEEEVRSAVEAATRELRAELDSLRASQEQVEVETRIKEKVDEATQPLQAQISELQDKLDAAVLEAQTEKARADALEAEKREEAEKAAREARKEERLKAVREAAPKFPDQYLNENADRWTAMSDEDFELRLEEYRLASKAAEAATASAGLPSKTTLKATTEGIGSQPSSAAKELFAMRRSGVDVRTL